jgi:two-component system chemotaxis response regulator CheY
MKQTPRILSVGQCGIDHGGISHALRRDFGAAVAAADTHADALAALRRDGPFDLVLVNRVGDADGASGLELIAALKSDPATRDVPAMLVSNYADAQAQAEALGALPGFGKGDLGTPRFRERVGGALNIPPGSDGRT